MESLLNCAIIEHLSGCKNVSRDVVESLQKELEVELPKARSPMPSLVDVFAAGASSLGIAVSDESGNGRNGKDKYKELFDQPKFVKYIEAISKKGYFSGFETGSQEYNDRLDKAVQSFKRKFGDTASSSSAAVAASSGGSDESCKEADKLKSEGNKLLEAREFEKAVEAYSEAIACSPAGPNSHIYYSNRAAAHQHLKNYEEALEDCAIAISLVPEYAKAHARAAQANFNLGRYDDARESADRTLEIDPNNGGAKLIIQQIEAKSGSVANGSSQPSGMPDMSGLSSMLSGMDPNLMQQAMGAMGGAGGGMPGLNSLMSNPAMMEMAKKLASNPEAVQAAQKMMNDPQAMQQMMSMMGGNAPGASGP